MMQLRKIKIVIPDSKLLRISFLTGFISLLLTTGTLLTFLIVERNNTREERQLDTFTRIMRDYDLLAAEANVNYGRLNRELDRLERRAVTAESWLSMLKRRRALSQVYPESIENYRKSVDKALEIFPGSRVIAAIAAETLILNTSFNNESETALRNILPVLTGGSFNDIRISLHILLGDFNNPTNASVIPQELFSDGFEAVTIDLIILKIIRDDIRNAAADISAVLQLGFPSIESLYLAAEFYYDFGDINRSAELFSLINNEKAILRQADALYLAGYRESARTIWSLVSDMQPQAERSFYNLAVTSQENDEAVFWFEKLINLQTDEITDSRQYGLIRYTRLLDYDDAVSLLTGDSYLKPASYPYIDLELIKRQSQYWELGRQAAEAWLLLDRHGENEDLYLWAAWLFLFQRNYNEIKILLNRMEINDFSEQWVKVFKAVVLMFEGDLNTAEDTLRSIHGDELWWPVYANLGIILETQRSAGRALEQYELAAELTPNPKTASRLQIHIARCYTVLNRPVEAIFALERALELDPGNLTARLELDRSIFSY